jgi:hypothetical protein
MMSHLKELLEGLKRSGKKLGYYEKLGPDLSILNLVSKKK